MLFFGNISFIGKTHVKIECVSFVFNDLYDDPINQRRRQDFLLLDSFRDLF